MLQRGKPCPSALRSSFHVEMSCACVPAIQDFGKKSNQVSMRRQKGARQSVSPHVPVPASGDAQHLPEEGVDEGGRHPPCAGSAGKDFNFPSVRRVAFSVPRVAAVSLSARCSAHANAAASGR